MVLKTDRFIKGNAHKVVFEKGHPLLFCPAFDLVFRNRFQQLAADAFAFSIGVQIKHLQLGRFFVNHSPSAGTDDLTAIGRDEPTVPLIVDVQDFMFEAIFVVKFFYVFSM